MPAVKEEHSVDANDNNKENNVNTNNNTNTNTNTNSNTNTNTNAITNTEQNNNSNTTNESVNNNQDTNTVDNPVVVTFKPEGNVTGVSANKKYNINVIFDVKDTSKTYYYIWKNYFYDEVNYRTECKKVVPGEHKGSFTVNGKRKANVTVYSDSSCTSEVTSVDSKTYTCRGGCPNDVDATFKPQNSVTSISKGTKYKINIDFKIRDKAHPYYYIWSNYLNGSNNYNTKCTKVTEGEHEGSFIVNGTRKVNVTLYRDASCKNKIKIIESKTYKCSNCPPLTISVGRNLSSSQTNGTVINNGFIFNIIDNTDTYYYKWRTYNNGSLWVEGSCIKVPTNGKQEVRDLTINSDLRVRKGTITVYSDSSCKNRISSVPIAETTTYRCSDCSPVTISIGRNLDSSQTQGTIIYNGVKITVHDNNNYYFSWRAYSNSRQTNHTTCEKVESGLDFKKNFIINGRTVGTITIYSDPACLYRVNNVPIAETTTYRCSNCDEVYNNNNSNSKSSSSSSGKSSSDSAITKKSCTTCPEGYNLVPWMNGSKMFYQCMGYLVCDDGRHLSDDGMCHFQGTLCLKSNGKWTNPATKKILNLKMTV